MERASSTPRKVQWLKARSVSGNSLPVKKEGSTACHASTLRPMWQICLPLRSLPNHIVVPGFPDLFRGRNFQRAHNAEAQELCIGQVPDALGQLRILLLPTLVGESARRAAELFRGVIPRTATGHVRISQFATEKWRSRSVP